MELIQRAQQGDEAAFQLLIDQHREAVFRLAYLLTGDADDAEDIAQETFIRAHRSLSHFDQERPFRPWLLSITTNLTKNRWRTVQRYLAAIQRFALQLSQETPSVEAQNLAEAEAFALWKAVQQLRTPEQEIIYLRYFLELSVEETAAALHIQPGTVKSRLHRALKQLRFVVEQDFPLLVEGRA